MTPPERTIDDVSAPYANFMANPASAGPGVCTTCWTFISPDYRECFKCSQESGWADLVVPITYSVDREQMHHTLRQYKDGPTKAVRDRFTMDLAALLWRFLIAHEPCLAAAAGVEAFSLVSVVPSATTERDEKRTRLRHIVGEMIGATKDRFERVLQPTNSTVRGYHVDFSRFAENVLLIDDTWTTGGSVQSAAYTLKHVGAATVTTLVIGRHISRGYQDNDGRLRALPPFDWDTCAVHA